MIHHSWFLYRLARPAAILLVVVMFLTACGGQATPTISPDKAVSITRIAGSATLVRSANNAQSELPASTQLTSGDQLYTAAGQTVTLQFTDGGTLQMEPDSHLQLFILRPSDRIAIFRLLAGSVTGDVQGTTFEVVAYQEVAMNFNMVITDLTVAPRGATGRYQLSMSNNILQATIESGEFDVRSGNQQATLPTGWQASAVPGQALQIISLITPTPAPVSATEAPTATPIVIISITPTSLPNDIPTDTATATATATSTRLPTRIPTRVPTILTSTPTSAAIGNTPAPTDKPNRQPKPTNPPPPPQPTNPPPPPQPTNPPPPRPTLSG